MTEGEELDPWTTTPEELMQITGVSRGMAEEMLYELRYGTIPDVIEIPEPAGDK